MHFERWLNDAMILVVDDEPAVADVLCRMLAAEGFSRVTAVRRPMDAIDRFRELKPDLVLLDYHMPQGNGVALLEEMNLLIGRSAYLPIMVLTGDLLAEAKQRALVCGAADFLHKPVEPFEFLNRVRNLLRTRHLYLQLQAEKEQLESTVAERMQEIRRAQTEILERLAVASDYRDDETGEHTRRIGDISARIGIRLGYDAQQVVLLRQAAQLHDVGKIGVSDEVLLAPGKLTPEQFGEMKRHTEFGRDILSGGRSDLLMLAEEIACCHHERWDGAGYPHGLKGDEIPLAARIVAVADFFDALTHDRRYRAALPVSEVVEMIRAGSGSHFDPEVVQAFLAEMER
jgi:putative two-component system response regulator